MAVLANDSKATERCLVLGVNNDNDRFNSNADDNLNNDRRAREWPALPKRPAASFGVFAVKTYRSLWKEFCTFEHLQKAYELAKKNKSGNPRVLAFEKNWRLQLCLLLRELREQTYCPKPLEKFVLRDPKTRVICVSDFRDRIVHHALVNILQPIFEPRFIADSYASRPGKGTLAALQRFDKFKRQVSKNGTLISNAKDNNQVKGFVLKADIKSYFDTVDQAVLLSLLRQRIKDENVLWLVQRILNNYSSGEPGKGMPLGNWTSQFFANVYLNELDQFVKQDIRAKYYLRYVDDFVLFHASKAVLGEFREKIKTFLQEQLLLGLHPTKSRIISLGNGVSFLGFRVFYHHKLVRRKNWRKIHAQLQDLLQQYRHRAIDARAVFGVLHGWEAYALHGNTYRMRKMLRSFVEENIFYPLKLKPFPVQSAVSSAGQTRPLHDSIARIPAQISL